MTFTYPEVTTIDTFYTTADGELITPQTLEYGTGYSLVEVQAPYGYVLNSEPVYFDVVQEDSSEESGITVIEVVRENVAQKGTITISKSGEVFSSVTEAGGMYQPVFAVGSLEGAVYEITAAEDIYTLDGTLRASKGEVVDTITTGADGTATSKELYLGSYEVKEITAPYGMVLNDEIHSVELIYAQRFEERFYQGNTPEADTIPPMPKFESSTELPEAVPIESDKKDETATDKQADTELITKLLSNPETAALLKALASKL